MRRFDADPLPGYPIEYGTLLATLQDGSREWRGELEEPDIDCLTWQPYPGSYSMAGVMLHIADVEIYWIEEFCLGREMSAEDLKRFMSDETKVGEGNWPAPPREPLSYYFQMLDEVRERTLRAMKEMPAPNTTKIRRDEELTFGWVLAHVVEHDSYHGGQVVMLDQLYKRMAK